MAIDPKAMTLTIDEDLVGVTYRIQKSEDGGKTWSDLADREEMAQALILGLKNLGIGGFYEMPEEGIQ